MNAQRKRVLLLFLPVAVFGCATTKPRTEGPNATGRTAIETEQRAENAPQILTFADEPFRKRQPKPWKVSPFDAPEVTRLKLDNGLQVYLIEQHQIPAISVDLVFSGGSIDDQPNNVGMASLCVKLMGEGTRELNKIQFEEALADLGSEVSTYASADQIGVTLHTLKKNFVESLKLWANTFRSPGLRKSEFRRLIEQRLTSLLQQKGSPTGVAARVGPSVIYGINHPKGRVVTEQSLKAITLEDCQTYLTSRLKPKGAHLFVAGDIGAVELKQRLQRQLFGWYGAPEETTNVPRPRPRAGRLFFVNVPGAKQAVIKMMHLGPSRRAPDYFPTRIMAAILGGGFSSRINMNIREEHGYSYGASGRFYYSRSGGIFRADTAVRNDVAGATVYEIQKEIKNMKMGNVSEEELDREIEGTIRALPARFTSQNSILQTYRMLVYYGLPLRYYDSFVQRVQRIKRADVSKAAKKHIQPDRIKILVVGDQTEVRSQLDQLFSQRKIPRGKFVILDADGAAKSS